MDGVVLLADKNSKSWEFAEKIREYLKEKKGIEIPLYEISISHFGNNEINMHVPKTIRQKSVYFIHDSNKNSQEWWVQLLLVKDLLLNASAENVSFVLPDMLYSRKDRKDKPHVPISARALSESISNGLKRIITMDLHASQIQGFYPANVPVDNLYSFPEAVRYFKKNYTEDLKNLVIVSPDAGGVARARHFMQRLDAAREPDEDYELSFAFIGKVRKKPGEIDRMDLVGDVAGKNVLIVDDLLDSGGTLCHAVNLLKENEAKKIFCYTTHGLFTKGTEELKKIFDAVITSNTHHQYDPFVEVVDVSPIFAEAIYRAQEGISISELFE